jgi:diguanylate cyclase (GGDEF)-like protein
MLSGARDKTDSGGAVAAVNVDGTDPAPRAVSLRGAWRLAGLLFVAGALTTIPASLLLEDPIESWNYVLTALGILSGIACLVLPWQRLDERWLALVPVAATAQIAAVVALTDPVFIYLYFFVALYIGLVFPATPQMWPFLTLIMLAMLAPLVYESAPTRETLLWVLAAAPFAALSAVVIGRLTSGLQASREAYRRLSTEDGLTGVGNYRSLMERLAHETARQRRRGREFALLTLDLDNFKQVNESQGHLVGDLVLATIASTLELEVRAEDAVFRQGGDEFSVVAPETDGEEAARLSERLERAVQRISSGEVLMSATVGYAIFPQDGADPAQLLDAADSSLLARKRGLQAPQPSV